MSGQIQINIPRNVELKRRHPLSLFSSFFTTLCRPIPTLGRGVDLCLAAPLNLAKESPFSSNETNGKIRILLEKFRSVLIHDSYPDGRGWRGDQIKSQCKLGKFIMKSQGNWVQTFSITRSERTLLLDVDIARLPDWFIITPLCVLGRWSVNWKEQVDGHVLFSGS